MEQDFSLLLPLAGLFQAANALVAAGPCIVTEAPLALLQLESSPGPSRTRRPQQGRAGVVDYALAGRARQGVKALRPFVVTSSW
jgi:UDP-N-acetylmuramyl tripeptide synthase